MYTLFQNLIVKVPKAQSDCCFVKCLNYNDLCRAPIRVGGTGGMPPVNFSQRVAATRQFSAFIKTPLSIHQTSTRQSKTMAGALRFYIQNIPQVMLTARAHGLKSL